MDKINTISELLIYNAINNYETDDIYILFNTDEYTKYLKNKDIEKLKQIILNKYLSIKKNIPISLDKMLSNCFKSDLKNTYDSLDGIYEISGIIRMTKYKGKGKTIYVVHEVHGEKNNKCKGSSNPIIYYDLYKSIFNISNKFFDLYIEGLFSDVDNQLKLNMRNNILDKNNNNLFYIDMLRSYAMFYCKENIRCHWLDIRLRLRFLDDRKIKTKNKSDSFVKQLPLSIIIDKALNRYNEPKKDTDPFLIYVFFSTIFGYGELSLNELKEKIKNTILHDQIDDYTKYLIQKQIKKIDISILNSLNIAMSLLINELFDTNSPLCVSSMVKYYGVDNDISYKYILTLLIDVTMEYFVLLRLFKNYDNEIKGDTKKMASKNSINALIHMGSLHSTNIEFILQKMNFKLLETTFKTDNLFCVNLKNKFNMRNKDSDITKVKSRFDKLNSYNVNAEPLNIKLFNNEKLSNEIINILAN